MKMPEKDKSKAGELKVEYILRFDTLKEVVADLNNQLSAAFLSACLSGKIDFKKKLKK